MKVLEIILPVLVMILLGMACKRLKLLDQNGINNMKLLVTQIMLPVAIFHALATSEYNKETGILVGIMFVMLVVSFSIGFLLRPLMPAERYQKYLPFMKGIFCTVSPVPIKTMVNMLGFPAGPLRLPLVEASPEVRAKCQQLLKDIGRL